MSATCNDVESGFISTVCGPCFNLGNVTCTHRRDIDDGHRVAGRGEEYDAILLLVHPMIGGGGVKPHHAVVVKEEGRGANK
jgi:hypothetical protein